VYRRCTIVLVPQSQLRSTPQSGF